MPGPASAVRRLWNTSSWSWVKRTPPSNRNVSLTLTVNRPNAAKFLKVEPKVAVPVGRVTVMPGASHGVSVVWLGAHSTTSRRKVRSVSARL